MKHDYTFNFGFLQKWMDANPHITKLQVMTVLHSSDYNAFNRWYKGEMPLPLSHILCLCNHFEIPLSCFFLDKEAPADVDVPRPDVNDQTEPSGGWKQTIDMGRGRRFFDPHADESQTTSIPESPKAPIAETDYDSTESNIPINIDMELTKRENAVRQECELMAREERVKLYNIIAQQTNQIADLTNKILSKDNTYHIPETRYGKVAESPEQV